MRTTTEILKSCVSVVTARATCRVSVLISLLLLPAAAGAQSPAPPQTELPTMVLKVCPKIEDAKSQADMSFQFGKVQGAVAIEPRFIAKGCSSLPVIARLRSPEESIRPYETWVVTYDPKSSSTFEAKHAGVTYTIPYSMRKQGARFFAADFMIPVEADDARIGPDDRGKWFSGWIEVPDEPYLSKYLERHKP